MSDWSMQDPELEFQSGQGSGDRKRNDSRASGTIRGAFVEGSSFLSGRGVEEAKSCAELLLQHLLGWTRTQLLLGWSDPFPEEKELEWQKLLGRKAAGEPVQYIMGNQEFYGRLFRVTPAVLIPRPETELLVQELLLRGDRLWPGGAPMLADIGTGSGAIPVTAAMERPHWRCAGVDISAAALAVAQDNARALGAAARVNFLEGDLLAPLIDAGVEVDILVSNPPYIPSEDVLTLQREVRAYEPHLALDGGEDGLDFYRRLVDGMKRLPRLPRLVGFEVGMGQAQAVAQMLELGVGGWSRVELVRDYAGIDRHVLAERDA